MSRKNRRRKITTTRRRDNPEDNGKKSGRVKKNQRRGTIPRADRLVCLACDRHVDEISYLYCKQNSNLDFWGIDIVITRRPFEIPEFYRENADLQCKRKGKNFKRPKYPHVLELQIKLKSGTETIGLILPLDRETEKQINKKSVVNKCRNHFKNYPDVPYIIFVGSARAKNSEEKVLADIWRELQKLLKHFYKNMEKTA